jgi:integrase
MDTKKSGRLDMVRGTSKNAINKLGDAQIQAFLRNHKARKPQKPKIRDGGGLYLTHTPAGTPVWRFKYYLSGKEYVYTIGTFAAYGLAEARREREAAKSLVGQGRHPSKERQLERAAAVASSGETFGALASEWLAKQKSGWSAVHYEKSKRALERDVYPRLGRLPVSAIQPVMVSAVIEAIVARGTRDTAAKVLQHVRAIFKLGQARGLVTVNAAEPATVVIPAPGLQRRRPALLTFPALGAVLRGAQTAHLTPVVRMAHRLLAFSAGVRIANVVEAQWTEFDLDADVPVWVIPRAQMKRKEHHHDHKVVLSPVIVAELREWRQLSGGKGYLFRSPTGAKHISPEALEKAYRETLALRDKHCPHGWRSAFSTLARDHGFDRDVVELALDHVHDNDVVRAYDRGERLEHRIKLMSWWGDQLTNAQHGADVVPLRKAG